MSEERIMLDSKTMEECLKEIAKEYHKRFRGGNIEIIIVGGASLALNYQFRNGTTDIDVVIAGREDLKDIINKVGDERGLPNGWLNQDFRKTESYSPKLRQYSKYYKSFYQCMEVRTIKDEYLIAMKLVSMRKYKHDRSDIVGILYENEQNGNKISFQDIDRAVNNLYGSWDKISPDSKMWIKQLTEYASVGELLPELQLQEKEAAMALVQFDSQYPGQLTSDNVEQILESNERKYSIDELLERTKNSNRIETYINHISKNDQEYLR